MNAATGKCNRKQASKVPSPSEPVNQPSEMFRNIMAAIKLKRTRDILERTMEAATLIGMALGVAQPAVDRAYQLVNNLYMKGEGFNIKVHVVAAASLYIACGQDSDPRTMREICHTTSTKFCDRKRPASCCTIKLLDQKIRTLAKILDIKKKHILTKDLIRRYCASLGLSEYVKQLADQVAAAANARNIGNYLPSSLAAAAISIASSNLSEGCTVQDIREVTGIRETIFPRIAKNLRQHFPEFR